MVGLVCVVYIGTTEGRWTVEHGNVDRYFFQKGKLAGIYKMLSVPFEGNKSKQKDQGQHLVKSLESPKLQCL